MILILTVIKSRLIIAEGLIPGFVCLLFFRNSFYFFIHNQIDTDVRSNRNIPFIIFIIAYKTIGNNSLGVLVPSENVKNDLVKHIKKPIIVANTGIKIPPLPERRKGNSKAFFVGRLIASKKLEEAISFSVKNKIELHVYGSGPENFKAINAAEKNNQIYYHGYSDNPWLKARQGDYLLCPSVTEGRSLSAMEGLARGLYLVVREQGPFAEFFDLNVIKTDSSFSRILALPETPFSQNLQTARSRFSLIHYRGVIQALIK